MWEGNRWLLFRQRERLDWFTRPVPKIAFLVVGCVFYTAPVTALAITAWFVAAELPVLPQTTAVVVLTNVICVLFVTHIYETAFLVKARRDDRVLVERLQRTRVEAELAALRSQVDPHFLFNALSALQWLIERDPPAAARYTAQLATVYRYLLANRDRDLVQLADELAFVDACYDLLAVRFGAALRLTRPTEGPLDRLLLPPSSLQLLLENAVKHNVFSEREPLDVCMELREDHIEVTNPRRPRADAAEGAGVGLANLGERYRLLVQREVEVVDDGARFAVKLPLVRVGA